MHVRRCKVEDMLTSVFGHLTRMRIHVVYDLPFDRASTRKDAHPEPDTSDEVGQCYDLYHVGLVDATSDPRSAQDVSEVSLNGVDGLRSKHQTSSGHGSSLEVHKTTNGLNFRSVEASR